MADRIVLNTISYHGHGAIENIVPELTARGYKKAFVCSDPDLIKFGVTKKVTDLLDAVSYTHLDVYKRQPFCCPKKFLGFLLTEMQKCVLLY